jgi:hypothetical protein
MKPSFYTACSAWKKGCVKKEKEKKSGPPPPKDAE